MLCEVQKMHRDADACGVWTVSFQNLLKKSDASRDVTMSTLRDHKQKLVGMRVLTSKYEVGKRSLQYYNAKYLCKIFPKGPSIKYVTLNLGIFDPPPRHKLSQTSDPPPPCHVTLGSSRHTVGNVYICDWRIAGADISGEWHRRV